MSTITNHLKLSHDSAIQHVTGDAIYINDMPTNTQMLTGKVVYSQHAHAKITSINYSEALNVKGVHAILSYKDIPGKNQMGPVIHDELCLAENEVTCIGQAILLIAAENAEIAREAEKLITIEYQALDAILDIETAIKKSKLIAAQRKIEIGDPDEAMRTATHVIKGNLKTGGQEHWYLETQTSLCVPGEGKEITVYASTQNPMETQAIVAEVLGIQKNEVECDVRRLGGGFGGKETSGNHVSAWAALLAHKTGRPVKIHLTRDDDQKITGKRHRFLSTYEVGFDGSGLIQAYKVEFHADAGHAADLSMAILERAMLHAENSYYLPNTRILGNAWLTNLPSNVAFRGFGGPQGIAVIETAIDKIARFLKKDALEIRYKNFYKHQEKNFTPYGEQVENNRLYTIYDQLLKSSDYEKRKLEIVDFNSKNEFIKKGIALTPVKFGISFTTAFLNQAGSLVNIYTDGTILVNHGGIEMGQGLYTKMQSIAAAEFGINASLVKVNATNTSKIPNTSATAASSGSDINGMAVKNAVDIIKSRLSELISNEFSKKYTGEKSIKENIVFEANEIIDSKNTDRRIAFKDAISLAYLNQVSLSSTGFYKTPDIYFDRATGKGKPFHYFAYGMAVSEVCVDTLTGQYKLLRSDVLHDVGDSLNPAIDKGQVEGAFIQGVGWCTTEEMKYNDKGHLLNHSPDTYKIPTVQDIPDDFRVALLQNAPNNNTIRKSKAVGEPPFVLGFSVWFAIKDAISAVGNHNIEPNFNLPATNEMVLLSIENLKKELQNKK